MAKGRKTGGRQKGTPNKATAMTKNIIASIAEGMYDKVLRDMDDLEPKDRVNAWLKLMEFVVAKPQRLDISLEGDTHITIEEQLAKLAEENDS